jgi:hypothetical protein
VWISTDVDESKLTVIDIETKRVNVIDPMIDTMNASLSTIGQSVAHIKLQIERYNRVLQLNNNIINYSAAYDKMLKIEEDLTPASKLTTADVRKKIETCEQIQRYLESIKKAEWSMSAADKFINASQCVNSFNQDRKSIVDKLERYDKITKLLLQVKNQNNDVQTKNKDLQLAEQKYKNAISVKTEILRESHICPTCYSEIDEHVISEIIKKQEETHNG